MIEKVKEALQSIVARFETGDIPEAIACSTFPIPKTPSAIRSDINHVKGRHSHPVLHRGKLQRESRKTLGSGSSPE